VDSGCHTPTLLDLIEEPLDQVASAVQARAEAECLFPFASRPDIRPSTTLADKGPDPVGIISTVSE
jgi:hypothetical protein